MRLCGLLLIGVALYGLVSCSRETGLPDPPLRGLVPCVADAGPDDPLACPDPAESAPDLGATDGSTD